jgi:hypothetical protein
MECKQFPVRISQTLVYIIIKKYIYNLFKKFKNDIYNYFIMNNTSVPPTDTNLNPLGSDTMDSTGVP